MSGFGRGGLEAVVPVNPIDDAGTRLLERFGHEVFHRLLIPYALRAARLKWATRLVVDKETLSLLAEYDCRKGHCHSTCASAVWCDVEYALDFPRGRIEPGERVA